MLEFLHNQQGENMSQISKILEEKTPGTDKAIQEATSLLLEESLKLLTPEQLATLKRNIIFRHPDVTAPSNGDGESVTYQLQTLISKLVSG